MVDRPVGPGTVSSQASSQIGGAPAFPIPANTGNAGLLDDTSSNLLGGLSLVAAVAFMSLAARRVTRRD